MTTTDLKPGEIVQHPEHGYGVVLKNFPGVPTIYFAGKHGYENTTRGFTGWERVKTVRPGHVQVRIDDLELGPSVYETEGEFVSSVMRDFPEYSEGDLRLIYRALVAQRAESTPPADEKPMSATVTLYCPDCGEPITNTAMVEVNREGDRYLDFCNVNVHTCPPAQPDEPTEPGTRVSVCEMRLVSLVQNSAGKRFFADVKSGRTYYWGDLTQLGTVTIGWSVEHD